MLKTQIKASQINNLTDARYFAAWGAEWLGFDLTEGSENYIGLDQIKEIKEWVEGPRIVGEFMLQTPNEIQMIVDSLDLDDIQINSFADIDYLKALEGLSIIKEVIIDQETTELLLAQHLAEMKPFVAQFLLNFDKSSMNWAAIQNNEKLPLSTLKQIIKDYKVILSINDKPKQMNEMLDQLQPTGINVKGGAEEKVGFKSFDEMDELFEVLEVFD